MGYSYKTYSDTKDFMKKYVNAEEGAIIYGISKSRIIVIAREAGAVYKVGNSALINTELFEEYLEQFREPARTLPKGAYAIHQSGKWYTDDNIDQMLMERHLNKKARRSSYKNHVKGTRKRTEEDDIRFAQSFERMVMKSLQETKR